MIRSPIGRFSKPSAAAISSSGLMLAYRSINDCIRAICPGSCKASSTLLTRVLPAPESRADASLPARRSLASGDWTASAAALSPPDPPLPTRKPPAPPSKRAATPIVIEEFMAMGAETPAVSKSCAAIQMDNFIL